MLIHKSSLMRRVQSFRDSWTLVLWLPCPLGSNVQSSETTSWTGPSGVNVYSLLWTHGRAEGWACRWRHLQDGRGFAKREINTWPRTPRSVGLWPPGRGNFHSHTSDDPECLSAVCTVQILSWHMFFCMLELDASPTDGFSPFSLVCFPSPVICLSFALFLGQVHGGSWLSRF